MKELMISVIATALIFGLAFALLFDSWSLGLATFAAVLLLGSIAALLTTGIEHLLYRAEKPGKRKNKSPDIDRKSRIRYDENRKVRNEK